MNNPLTIDPTSLTWVTVKAWAEDQLRAARAALEAEGTTHDQANILRGRIAAAKDLLRIAEPQPDIPSEGTPYTG